MITSYLRHSEERSEANLASMAKVAAILAAINGPWIWAGDFNMSHGVLSEGGWIATLGGAILATEKPSFVGSGSASFIDYFVVPRDLIPRCQLGAQVIDGTNIRMHKPVRLELQGGIHSQWMRALRLPEQWDKEQPIGYVRKPNTPAWQTASTALRTAKGSDEDLSRAWWSGHRRMRARDPAST